MAWLRFEVSGFERTDTNTLTAEAFLAARRSNRTFLNEGGEERAISTSLGELQAIVDASSAQLTVAAQGLPWERSVLRNAISENRGRLEKVVGAIHEYVAVRYQELRFGSAVETAFEVVRGEVDGHLAELVPDALPKLTAAFENVTSDNPEDWASAAATCRRLLKVAADALRPAGPPVNGHEMTDSHYINRLVDWIGNRETSQTAADMMTSDLEYLGRRLDAADDAGHKGAHADVGRVDAARFVAGTYLLLGDILRLRNDGTKEKSSDPPPISSEPAS